MKVVRVRGHPAGVANPAEVRALEVSAVASLDGLERFTRLDLLELTGVRPGVDLAPLRTVAPTLTRLRLERVKGDFDGSPIAALTRLEELAFDTRDADAARAFARVDLSGLERLEVLDAITRGERVPLRFGPVERLAFAKLHGFTVRAADVDALCRAPCLESLAFAGETPRVAERLRACLGPRAYDLDAQGPSPLRVIHEHDGEFSIGLDLAEDWDLETAGEAEDVLRGLVPPALSTRVDYDTGGSIVWVLARSRDVLDAVLALADEETRRRGT